MFLLFNLLFIVKLSLTSSIVLLMLFNCFLATLFSLANLQLKIMGWCALIELWWLLPYTWAVLDFLYIGNLGLHAGGLKLITHLIIFSIYAIAYIANRICMLSRCSVLPNDFLYYMVSAFWHSLMFALLAVWVDRCFFRPLSLVLVPIYYNANSTVFLAVFVMSYIEFSLYIVFDGNPIVAEYYIYVIRILLSFLVFFFTVSSFFSV